MYVYIIQCQDCFKIGKANDVQKRLAGLQTSSPFKLHLVAQRKVKDAYATEKNIHKTYGYARVRGEWFYLSDRLLRKILKSYDFDIVNEPLTNGGVMSTETHKAILYDAISSTQRLKDSLQTKLTAIQQQYEVDIKKAKEQGRAEARLESLDTAIKLMSTYRDSQAKALNN